MIKTSKTKKPAQKLTAFQTLKRILLLSICIIILISLLINGYMIAFSSRYIFSIDQMDEIPKKYAAMSLGAKVYRSGSLSHILMDRVNHAVILYQNDKVERLLFSGDHGRYEYDEVNAMMDDAVRQGVPESDIFLDHAGFSTYESMVRAVEIFECDDLIIVTQKFHLYRAVYIARRKGIDAVGVNSDYINYRLRTDFKNLTREYLARVKDFFTVEVFHPAPTYLGDKIPITGDSGLTHDQ